MPVNLKGRSFLTLKDFTTEEIRYLLDLSRDLKAKKRAGIKGNLLFRKNIVLIFDKASTRTRCAFETACWDEGGNATFLTNSQMGKKESVEDTAKVLGRMYDGIQYRGFSQKLVEDLAKHSGVPVWNGLTDADHPTQILADLLTIEEHVDKPLGKVKLVYCGDARNNMGNALMIGSAKMGMRFVALAPKELWPNEALAAEMKARRRRRPAARSTSSTSPAPTRPSRAPTPSTPTSGSPWARRPSSRSASSSSRSTASRWTSSARPATPTASSSTASRPSTTPRPRWARTSGRSTASRRWKSPTRSSAAATRWCSTRPRTGCTRLKQ